MVGERARRVRQQQQYSAHERKYTNTSLPETIAWAQFDVTEFMQGRVDLAEGKYLFLSKEEHLSGLFGDPCPGRDKCLMLHYEILGSEGKAESVESDDRLLTPINISCT